MKMRAKQRTLFAILVIGAMAAMALGGCAKQTKSAQPSKQITLRILAWVGYDESEFVEPLEKELGVKIEVKTYVGGDQMYSLFTAAPPGTYDLVVVDAEYGERMYKEGLLRKIDRRLWTAPDLFEPFSQGEPVRVGEDVYGVVVRWGALGLVYNTKHITAEQAQSYKVLWSPQVRGRVVIFDWYLPNMGVISRFLGHPKPYDLDKAQLQELKQALLRLRPQVRAFHVGTGDVINDLRRGEAWVCPGIGEWAAAVLMEEGKPIDWSIPKEGGVMWIEAFAIPTSAKNVAEAERFLEVVRRPEHLARLAWRKAYHSQTVRRSAYKLMTSEQRRILKAQNLDEIQALIKLLSIRKLPGPRTTEKEWMRVWAEFKAGSR
jgi:spermidine/putrescine transport system substrate-binding protein